MKSILIIIAITITIWLTHNNYLVKVSKLEKKIILERKELEDLKKELNEKRLEYEKVSDLKKLEIEMRDKRNMQSPTEINYFQIKE